MKRNNRQKLKREEKLLVWSVFIFISAVLFAILAQWIMIPPAYAVSKTFSSRTNTVRKNQFLAQTVERVEGQPILCFSAEKRVCKRVSSLTPILDGEEPYLEIINQVSKQYPDIPTEVIRSIIWHESRFQPGVRNGNCVGLMQVSTKWHANRAKKLGVTDFYDPYSNILLGVDYIDELLSDCGDLGLSLMIYNGDSRAYDLYSSGLLSDYASGILSMSESLSEVS